MKKIVKWKDKTSSQKRKSIAKLIAIAILFIGAIFAFIFYHKFFGEDSIFNQNISSVPFFNFCFHAIPTVIASLQAIILGIVLDYVLQFIMHLRIAKTPKGITIKQIFASFCKWAIAIVVILLVLAIWGVNTTALLASAGVLTLVIGLGAQSLIADIVAGIFIVFENEYEVGDIIVIDGFRGTVSEIGIRTTKLEDAGGNIKIINNSEIKTVINRTKALSVAKCYLSIKYDENIDHVEEIINKNLPAISKKIKGLKTNIQYLGISEYADSGVVLFFIGKCKENDVYQTQREMNRQLRKMLNDNGVDLSYTTYVIKTEK